MGEYYDDQIWAAETPREYNSVKTVNLCDSDVHQSTKLHKDIFEKY